jgi:hypothetical protein
LIAIAPTIVFKSSSGESTCSELDYDSPSSHSRRDSILRSGPLSSKRYSFVFSLESFSRMNASISGALDRMRSHCSLYSVTGNRPMPYRETPPFSLTFKVRPPLSLLFSWAFSARRRSNSACISDSLIVSLLRFPAYIHFASFPARRFLTGTYRHSVSRPFLHEIRFCDHIGCRNQKSKL